MRLLLILLIFSFNVLSKETSLSCSIDETTNNCPDNRVCAKETGKGIGHIEVFEIENLVTILFKFKNLNWQFGSFDIPNSPDSDMVDIKVTNFVNTNKQWLISNTFSNRNGAHYESSIEINRFSGKLDLRRKVTFSDKGYVEGVYIGTCTKDINNKQRF